eukprot:g7726.t1
MAAKAEPPTSNFWEGEWVCADCGYIYDIDDCGGLYLEEQKRGFVCPQCRGPRRRFAKKVGDKVGITQDGGDAPILIFSFLGLWGTVAFFYWFLDQTQGGRLNSNMSTSWIVRSVALVAIASAVVIEPVISAPSPVGTIEAPTTASAVDFSSTFSYSYEPWNDDDDYAIPTDGQACSNGIRGVESDNGKVCCVAECGSCGGVGCSRFSPELEADDCCVTEILEDGEACSVWGEAPCFIDGQSPVPSPIEDAPTSTSPTDTTGAPCYLFEKSNDGDMDSYERELADID